ncbi:hypothetical protein [Aureispira anguillae]|uniref:Uncharacterized protein n=1 Tax=Aureispira anguillae TaxID=2864201 RepID=A0A916DS22_9BACT|nr:hypothetical protein [Aureispira anguillae]BDS12234.1 hypothetical protein AsAng_0029530 [Aureispira anguillae]
MVLTKRNLLATLLTLVIGMQFSCKKDAPAPINPPPSILEQFYSIGAKQVASDLIRTSDGGYLMVGTSYPNTTDPEGDIVVIKTDSIGVQQWHSLLGKTAGAGTGNLAGMHIEYHEEGVKIAELPNQTGYTVAANRTYVAYPTASSTTGTKKQTKIVMYSLDNSGAAQTADGHELRANTDFTENVSDFKIDNSNGNLHYILTGYTTNVNPNKPNDPNNGIYDLTDIVTILMDASFSEVWATGATAYGFLGKDHGTSVQILPDGYLVVGTIEEQHTANGPFMGRLAAIKMRKDNGVPTNPMYFGDQDYNFEGAYSTYDATAGHITIAATVAGGNSAYTGQIAVLQLDENLNAQTPNPIAFGLTFLDPTPPTATSINNSFKVQSIAALPNNDGFLIASTMTDNLGKDICISKLNDDFSLPATDWPYYHGYTTGNSMSTTQELAGTVLPVIDNNTLIGHAFTGTFNANSSNSQIGWVRF